MVIAPRERWRQIEALFAKAVDLSLADRAEFVRAQSGGDPELRRDLERLLAAHDRSGDFLEEADRSRFAALLQATPHDVAVDEVIGPYRIVRRLGEGGMGVVYLARDSRLGRAVALKLLSLRVAESDIAKRRFIEEAKAASALDHPRIATIYEMGEAPNGRLYIAMAYCEGETLREMIDRGPLPVDTAIDLAGQIADGLSAAHAAGIVHRDIKPGNVIVGRDGMARIVDFGVAKSAGDALTQPGATLGTIAYMSPEQTRGDRVDPRTDLWSLGVTLYEMLSGVRPFRAEDDQALIYAIRHDTSRSLHELRPDAPPGVVQVVERCLTKDPANRYADARTLIADLDAVARGTAALGGTRTSGRWLARRSTRVLATTVVAALGAAAVWGWQRWRDGGDVAQPGSSIAVMPFTAVGSGPDTTLERLGRELVVTVSASLNGAAGLRTVEPIAILAQVEPTSRATATLSVVAPVGRRLGAGRLVHGTLVRSGGQVRVDAGIFDASDLAPHGRVTTVGPIGDIAKLTDAVSVALLRQLGVGSDIQAPSLAAITTASVPALREYLAGEQAIARAQFRAAPEHFARAIAADSTFWFAYWRYLYARSYHGERVDSSIVATVRAHRHEFPEVDRLLIESRLGSGQRERLARRQEVVRLFPDYWPAWFELGDQLTHHGPYLGYSHDETRNALERAVALNPGFVPAWEHLFWIENRSGDTLSANRTLRILDAIQLDTLKRREWNLSTLTYYHCLHELARSGGTLSEACAAAGVRDLTGYHGPMAPERLAVNLTQTGFHRGAIELAGRIQAEPSSPSAMIAAQSWATAIASAGRGDWRAAIEWAERYARTARHPNGPLWAYGLAVTGVWLGLADDGATVSLRSHAVRSTAGRSPAGAAELAWLDGLLSHARRDSAGLARTLQALRDASITSARALTTSIEAFATELAGNRDDAARSLAALEWANADSAWHYRHGPAHPFVNSVNRLAAGRWLLASGDTAQASRLLMWHEADFPGTLHPLQAVNVALGGLALVESARIEQATGRSQVAASFYRRFLQRYDRPPAQHRTLVEQARRALSRLSP